MEAAVQERAQGALELDTRNQITSLTWLIQLRWYAIVILALLTIVFAGLFGVLPAERLVALFAVLSIAAACNYAFGQQMEQLCEKTVEEVYQVATLQVILDVCALVLFVHFSGGVENPLLIAIALPLIAACWLLPRGACNGLAAFALVLIATFASLEAVELVHHTPLSFMDGSNLWQQGGYIVLLVASLAGLFFGSIHFTSSLVGKLNGQQGESTQRAQQLEEKVNALEAVLEGERIERSKLEEAFRMQVNESAQQKEQLAVKMKAVESGVIGKIEKLATKTKTFETNRTALVTDLERDVSDLREALERLEAARYSAANATIARQAQDETAGSVTLAESEELEAQASAVAQRAPKPVAEEEDLEEELEEDEALEEEGLSDEGDEEDEDDDEEEDEEEDEGNSEDEEYEEETDEEEYEPDDQVSAALLAALREVEESPAAESILMDVVLTEDLPEVMGDPELLQDLFGSLLTCSIHSMPDGGRISIATTCEDKSVNVTITDSSEPSDETVLPPLKKELKLAKKLHARLSATAVIDDGATYTIQIPTEV